MPLPRIKEAAIRLNGINYTGRRHHIILVEARTKHGLGFGGLKTGQQGFITEDGVFLDREKSAKVALAAGQIKALRFSDTELFSEDLY